MTNLRIDNMRVLMQRGLDAMCWPTSCEIQEGYAEEDDQVVLVDKQIVIMSEKMHKMSLAGPIEMDSWTIEIGYEDGECVHKEYIERDVDAVREVLLLLSEGYVRSAVESIDNDLWAEEIDKERNVG